ncbi:unnamed protein product [Ambrosiozyma monospora]|uniref:Unnamed protein product n=1 Tax=Ambrosiozyma monospora TaxID=43982 RepID=A0ACB5T593_AMBMO|nr:unnamed protein product [Ambrosiozyma monospora]
MIGGDNKKKIKHFNDEVFISPKVLQDNGIKVFGTYQQPNEYIIKFPKAYSSCVSLGTTVNEGVNFATKSWLPLSQDASNWLTRQSILPSFSTWKYLINVAKQCDDVSVIGILEPLLSRMVEDELELRTQVRSVNGIKETNNSGSNVDSVTDADLVDCFPSYVKLTDSQDKKSNFTMSLKKFLQTDYESAQFNNDFKIELVTLASDEQLKTIVKSIKVRLVTGKEWLDKYMEFISGYDKPSYKLLKPFLFEGELIFENRELEIGSSEMEAFEKFKNLKEQMDATDTWCKRANKFLQTKNTSRVRQRSRNNNNNHDTTHASNGSSTSSNDSCGNEIPLTEVSELVSLLREIPSLPVSAPEMDELLVFAQEVSRFNCSALAILQHYETNDDGKPRSGTTKLPSDEELENLYLLGESSGVKLNTFQLLDRILQRKRWLKEVSQSNVTALNSESLLKLIEDGERYASLDDKPLMDRLHKDYIDCVNANNQLLDAMGCRSGNKDGGGEVTEDGTGDNGSDNGSANGTESDHNKKSNGDVKNSGEKRIDMDLVTELFNKNMFLPIDSQVRETFHSLSHEFKVVSNQLDAVLELINKRDELIKEFTVNNDSQVSENKVGVLNEEEIDFNRLAEVVDQIHEIACSTSVSGPGGNTTATNLNNNSGPTIQQLHDIVNKSAKFSNLDSKIAILQPHLKLVESWSTRLRSRFLQSHYPRSTKKLTNLFNEQLQRNDVIFNEPWESENYCVCRLSHEDDMMVECESCQTWCHFKFWQRPPNTLMKI